MEIEDIVGPYHQWEKQHSDLDYREGKDLVEVRLVNNSYCRDNGWRGEDGLEHWDKARAWSRYLVKNNIGYRFVRALELADAGVLGKDQTPLILDSVGCVSDAQFNAIGHYLSKGGIAWLALPFGTHDEKGYKRPVPLSEKLKAGRYKNLMTIDTATKLDPVKKMISEGKLKPVLTQLAGDTRWAARIRFYKDKPVIHMMNTAIAGVPRPGLKDNSGVGILSGIRSLTENNNLSYEIDTERLTLNQLKAISPELRDQYVAVSVKKSRKGYALLNVNLESIKVYAEIKALVS